MTKKTLNQNAKYVQELVDTIEPDFIFSDKPINRFKIIENNDENTSENKTELLLGLREKINTIENCNLKNNSKNLIMGDGNINSPIMLIGEAPGENEDIECLTFCGDIGVLLNKMLLTKNILKKNIYTSYSINFAVLF